MSSSSLWSELKYFGPFLLGYDLFVASEVLYVYVCFKYLDNWVVYSISYFEILYIDSRRATDANKSGVAQETLQNTMRRAGKVMTEQEARQILGVTEETAWEEVLKVGVALRGFIYTLLQSKEEIWLS